MTNLDKIICGDCLNILPDIPNDYADMTFADPPFNLGKAYKIYNDRLPSADYYKWCEQWLTQMVRITKPTGSIFVHGTPKRLINLAPYLNKLANFKAWIAWNTITAAFSKGLSPNHYGFLWYCKSSSYKCYNIRAPHSRCRHCGGYLKDYGGKEHLRHPLGAILGDVWIDIHRIRHKQQRDEHPCQLPVPLLERLILLVTDEEDIVVDPFLGTGTTAVAAKTLNRHFIGIDIDSSYVQLAINKLSLSIPNNNSKQSIFLGKVITLRD